MKLRNLGSYDFTCVRCIVLDHEFTANPHSTAGSDTAREYGASFEDEFPFEQVEASSENSRLSGIPDNV